MSTRWIIGLASGSSVDGVDAALLETEGAGLDLKVRPMMALHQPYSHDLRDLICRVGAGSKAGAATPAAGGGQAWHSAHHGCQQVE